MSDHAFIHENLAGYVADGLTAEERERFERHIHGCGDCHRLVEAERAFDESLGKLFASARPAAGFENRVLTRLRAEPMKRRIAWTKTWRWIGSAAAVLMLGVVGFGMQHVMEKGSLPFPGEWGQGAVSQDNSKQVALRGRQSQAPGRIGAGEQPVLGSDWGDGDDARKGKAEGKPNGSMGQEFEDTQDKTVKLRLKETAESLPDLGVL